MNKKDGLPGAGMEIGIEEHQRVMKEGIDVPEQPPALAIAIQRVGIESNRLWVNLPQGRLAFDASIYLCLPAEFRGIHMSRIEEAVSRSYHESYPNLKAFARTLASRILSRQRGNKIEISLSGLIPLARRTPVSQKESVESLKVFLHLIHGEGDEQMELGIEIEHMTACPCTQAYHNTLLEGAEIQLPLPTHSQRTITRFFVNDRLDRLDFIHLLIPAEECLHIIQGLLKRPDEAELVLKAHRRPQFVEDVVRELAASAGRSLSDRIDPDATVRIESTSIESIHTHNVVARLEMPFRRILAPLRA
jgi:GTP cyclohydrolase FolE2